MLWKTPLFRQYWLTLKEKRGIYFMLRRGEETIEQRQLGAAAASAFLEDTGYSGDRAATDLLRANSDWWRLCSRCSLVPTEKKDVLLGWFCLSPSPTRVTCAFAKHRMENVLAWEKNAPGSFKIVKINW